MEVVSRVDLQQISMYRDIGTCADNSKGGRTFSLLEKEKLVYLQYLDLILYRPCKPPIDKHDEPYRYHPRSR